MSEIESLDDIRRLILSGKSNWKQYGEINHQIEGDLILFDYSQKHSSKTAGIGLRLTVAG